MGNWQKTNNKGTWGGDWNVYTYDALNRLVREKEMDTGLTITYGYDSLGNKTLEQDSRDNLRYTYNELNQLITKEAYNRTTNYSYDNRGNRILETSVNTQENRRTYEWDETNRLVKGTRSLDYGLYTSEYTYNALGQRVNSTIMGPDKTKYDRDYTIDYTSPDYHDIAEYNTGHYQWQPPDSAESGGKKVHDLTYLYTADGQRLQVDATRYSQWSPEAVTYKLNVHEEILGSGTWYTRQESGYNANHHDYTTWGNNTKAPTYNYDPEYRATEPYYTGHPYGGSLNIYYAKNRFYDAETGSWLSPDPAKDGLNWYQYCGSNPVTYIDMLGLYWNSYYQKLKGSVDFEFTKNDMIKAAELGFTNKEQLVVFGDIRKYLSEHPDLRKGVSIFVFEGLGNYEGGTNQYHPQGQFGAMIVITRSAGVTYMTPNASSLPDLNTKTVDEGIYMGVTWHHQGRFDAIQIRTLNDSEYIPSNSGSTTATGVNIHAADGKLHGSSNWSEGCITVKSSEYLPFLGETGAVNTTDYGINDLSSVTYANLKNGDVKKTIKEVERKVGYIVIDRQHMPLEYMIN